jgi:AcrR family transcriptional regulator
MPKKPDKKVEGRILDAAYQLWIEGGEHALTMRAVARRAATTTPTLYERFRDKRDLLLALQARAQEGLFNAIKPARSITDACRFAIDFTLAHAHEYELVAKDWAARLSRKEPTPAFDLIKGRLAEQFGGAPEDHVQLALGLATLCHGASMLLLGEGVGPDVGAAIKEACVAATDSLMATAARTKSIARPD